MVIERRSPIVAGATFWRLIRPNDHGNLWWVFDRELRNLRNNGIRFNNRLKVTYPHNSVAVPNTSYAAFEIYLHSDHGPENPGEPRSWLHQVMHNWHVHNLRVNLSPLCLLGANHKPPDTWNNSRCTGFQEGVSEAIARRIMHERYGPQPASRLWPTSQTSLRSGAVYSYPIVNLRELERTDDGWEHVLRYLFSSNEMAPDGLNAPNCNAQDVTVYEFMNALEDAIYGLATPRVLEALSILEEQIPRFTDRDSRLYAGLTGPTNVPANVVNAI